MEIVLGIMFISGLALLGYLLFFAGKDDEEIVFEEVRDPVILHIAVPRQNDKTPLAAEQMFASLHGIVRDNRRSTDFLSFEIVSDTASGVNFYAAIPKYLVKFVEGQIYAQYPNAEIMIVEDYVDKPLRLPGGTQGSEFISTAEIELVRDFIFPIKTFRDFDVDPLSAITSAVTDVDDGEQVMLQILMRPVDNYWQDYAKDYIEAVREGKDPASAGGSFWKAVGGAVVTVIAGGMNFFISSSSEESSKGDQKPIVRLLPGQEEELRQITEKMTQVGFEMCIRIVTKAQDGERADQLLRDVTASFKQFTTANLNGFTRSKEEVPGAEIYNRYKRRYLSTETVDILNISELASLYHLPNISVETPNISWSRAKKAEPPMNLPIEDSTIFAETDYRGRRVPFGIKRADRRLHYYLLGKTGTGKSTVFKNMIISDILAGEGVAVVDPHGELVEDILNFIPSNRVNDVVYFDPSDTNNPIGFNMLQLDDMDQRDLVADGVVEVFKKHFEYSWGPRLQYILHNTVLTILEVQGQSLLAVQRLLIDTNFRKFIVKQIKDPVLLKFWNEEYASMATNSRLITEAVAPIQNKVGRFLSSATIRNIVGQVKSTIDLAEIMNENKIFLVNLSQGRLGEESSALLGGMIVTRLQSTAMQRVKIPEADRKDFFLFVDEFQNYATDSFAKILSEARKYHLCLHLTHQYIDQLPENVRQAIFGNAGTICSFVVGPGDAPVMAQQFAPTFDEDDMVSMDLHAMYLKMSIDGQISAPFSARSLDIRYQPGGYKDTVIQASRERYGRNREIVEDKIRRWSEQSYSEKGNRSLPAEGGSDRGNGTRVGTGERPYKPKKVYGPHSDRGEQSGKKNKPASQRENDNSIPQSDEGEKNKPVSQRENDNSVPQSDQGEKNKPAPQSEKAQTNINSQTKEDLLKDDLSKLAGEIDLQ